MLRRLKRRTLRLIIVIASLCYMLSVLIIHTNLDHAFSAHGDKLYWIKPFYDPFQIAKPRSCSLEQPKGILTSSPGRQDPKGNLKIVKEVCMVDKSKHADIQMNSEWEQISVGYPQLVLTVTGWVDTIQVDSWSMGPLQVVIVPFSHQDPGWRDTYDSYYQSSTKSTLSLIVSQLTKNPSWKFVWSETVFLERWWDEATVSQRKALKRLLQNGQLELLGGGWVMPDEASTHYTAILDQMMEGHLWIAETLGLTINTSWAIDPFGHSPTIAYFNRKAGIKNMLIQRTHFAVKRHFAKRKYLEFHWQQPWGGDDKSVFCHMMPFLLYSIPHSCGPNRHVCCQFDFNRGMCFKGKEKLEAKEVTDSNLASLAQELWQQLRKKSELYRSNIVLMPHGDDFRYSSQNDWNNQFDNLGKLMEFINNSTDMNMKIEYGTLSDYFNKLYKSMTGPKHKPYPTLTGDFFPYSDRGDQYWSGHYTSRPFHKRIARLVQSKLRSAEILYTMAQARKSLSLHDASVMYDKLRTVRRTLALFQHHDAITGTSKKDVVRDYAKRLFAATKDVHTIQGSIVQSFISNINFRTVTVYPTDIWLDITNIPSKQVIDVKTTRYLVVHNPLFHWQRKVITVHVNSVHVTLSHDGESVRMQLSPSFDNNNTVKAHEFVLSFEVNLSPTALVVYHLKPSKTLEKSSLANVTIFGRPTESKWFRYFGPFDVSLSSDNEFTIGNSKVTATVSACDGSLKFVHQDGNVYKSDVHFVKYKTGSTYNPLRDKSGAYIFLPDGPAEELPTDTLSVIRIIGQLFTQVRAVSRDIIQKTTTFNITGPEGTGVQVENLVNIGNSRWNNSELALRLETDIISSEHQLCTDSNGFQMQSRKTRSKFGIQGNFYPVTTSAFLEDERNRITLLTTEAHGVASLASGMIDIMLDRRLMQDDWRGLDEGVQDNQPTESSFFLLFENRNQAKVRSSQAACYLSSLAANISTSLDNPPMAFTFADNEAGGSLISMPKVTSKASPQLPSITKALNKTDGMLAGIPMVPSLPCDYHLVNLRMFKVYDDVSLREALIVVYRKGTECSIVHEYRTCSLNPVTLSSLLPFMDIKSVKEMSITGVTVTQDLSSPYEISLAPMEIRTYKIAFR